MRGLKVFRPLFDFFWGPADPRAYALVRVALAIAGLANLVELWPHRLEYFGPLGMVPLPALRSATQGKYYWSLLYLVDSDAGVTAAFALAALALLALAAGVGSRAAAAAVLAWHLSYCNRAFPVLHGWDAVLRSYTFLVFLSPLGRVWSLDRLIRPRPSDEAPAPAYGLRLMQWQTLVLYTTTVWLKLPDGFWRSGQLMAYFSISQYSRTPDDLFLVRHEWISALATYASLAIEASVPWLLWMKRTRPLGLVAGLGLHFVIGATAKLGVFSTCMVPAYLSFLDRGDIDWLVSVARARTLGDLRARITSLGTETPRVAGSPRGGPPAG
jgi:hypothetical protein